MIIKKVVLHNWQGYYGTCEFNFDGSAGRSSGFIYADNTIGKTAFWEAFQFVLFGRVERRKMPKVYKPIIAEDSGDYPLLNTDEYGKVGARFFVEVFFSHDGSEYRLYRGYKPRFQNKPVTLANDLVPDISLENLSERGNERHVTPEDRWIKENILPDRLSKFFLFDGERLEEYEDLMEDEEDIDLRTDIENIIRIPILSEGVRAFNTSSSRFGVLQAKAKNSLDKNKERAKTFDLLSKELKESEESLKKLLAEKEEFEKQLGEVDQWLLDNNKTKEAVIKLEAIKEKIRDGRKAESGFRKDIIREMEGAWRVIISPMVNRSKEKLEKEAEDQKNHIMQMQSIDDRIRHLKHELDGEPCEVCKRARDAPSPERVNEAEKEISNLEAEFEKHNLDSRYPTQEQYTIRKMALNSLGSRESDLSVLFEKEDALMDQIKSLREAKKDKEKQEEELSEEKDRLVKSKLLEKKSIEEKMSQASKDETVVRMTIEGYLQKLQEFTDTGAIDEKEPGKIRKFRRSREIADGLRDVFKDSLEEYRELMRKKVERRASETFLQISNNRKHYKGLKITDKYAVSIINKKGKRDAGSQAQSLVMAYSIIEALSSCSGFVFPLIIDTPGRGLAKSNVSSVYDFFIDSDRQVIFLPNDLELDPDIGDKKYRKKVAATYELIKVDEDRTEVLEREVTNLR